MDELGFKVIRKSNKKINKGTVLVFLATFNRSKKIINSIESILKQEYENVLLHIVDDFSSDNTIDVICDYIDKNGVENITLSKSNKNRGKYYNLNYCLYTHKKDDYGYWTCQDSDDISKPKRISDMVNYIKKTNESSVGHTYERKGFGVYKHGGIGVALILYRKKVFDKLGYYDNTRFGADSEYYDRHLKYISKVKCLSGNHFYWADYDTDCLTSKHKPSERHRYVNKYRGEIRKGLVRRDWVGEPKTRRRVDITLLKKNTRKK